LFGTGFSLEPREVSLPSGKKVFVAAVGTLNFPDDTPALFVKYHTKLSISDLPALRKEADELWSIFKVDAEQAKMTKAIISANEVPEGLILQMRRGYNFVFQKVHGKWQPLRNRDQHPDKPKHLGSGVL
jgi:hypothetical protein